MREIFSLVLIIILLALSKGFANAQHPKKIPQIGWIALFGRSSPNNTTLVGRKGSNMEAFMQGLRERGYVEGQNIIIDHRSAEGREDRLSQIAAELVRLKVDVIVADTNAATRAAKKATTTVPIVFVYGDPVWDGLVASLARPGGNLTGLSILAPKMAGKRLELLRDTLPKISRIAVLLNPDASVHRGQFAEIQPIAQALSVQLQALELRDSQLDFEKLFQRAVNRRANALLTLPNPTVTTHRTRVLDFVAKSRLPAMYPDGRFADSGGLMSYGPSLPDLYRRAAFYVDKILKGAKPADLPVEQPTKFELVINLNTAKTLGLTIPSKVLMWADRVISSGDQKPEKSVATTSSIEKQGLAKIRRIGVLSPGSGHGPALEAFRQKLRALGWVDGDNIALEYRWAQGNESRLPALAAELLLMDVDIIVATSAQGARAAQRLTRTTPIVATGTSDPVGTGVVKSLDQPGGNLTGLSILGPELGGKRLELLKEIIPKISRVAVLAQLGHVERDTALRKIEAVARSLGVQLQIINVKKFDEIENAFSSIVKGKVGALTILTQSTFGRNRTRIVELAANSRLPTMYPSSEFVEAGGLISYGPDRLTNYRRAAYFVDKILKGAKPSDLPVEQPTKFELVINLKTAKQIGVTIPPEMLMWADRVIK